MDLVRDLSISVDTLPRVHCFQKLLTLAGDVRIPTPRRPSRKIPYSSSIIPKNLLQLSSSNGVNLTEVSTQIRMKFGGGCLFREIY